MRRIANGMIRPSWEETNRSLGLVYGQDYWREGPFYDFELDEILVLEQAATTLHRMCVVAGDHMARQCPRSSRDVRHRSYLEQVCTPEDCLLTRIGIPEYAHEQIIRTWHDNSSEAWQHGDKDLFGTHAYAAQGTDYSPSVYGRFDLWYGGRGTTPKLLEYNAQTPTSLLEAAVVQWQWMEQTMQTWHPERHWSSMHDRLIAAWQRNMAELRAARPWLPEKPVIHFAYDGRESSGEDLMTAGYLMETAHQAGFPTELMTVADVGIDHADGSIRFNGKSIDVIFMLYPWEWVWHEEGGKPIFLNMADPTKRGTVWIEPPWTALWSGKALLAVLWELFPGNDLLLPAYFEQNKPASMTSFARKPLWSREGANVSLVRNGQTVAHNEGAYGSEGFIYQELKELPEFDGNHPVLGVWMIDGEPAGLGIREGGLITGNGSFFVPHTIGSYKGGSL